MGVVNAGDHSYFEYMRLAKKAFQALLELHPELEKLSRKELEVFEQLLSDKTLPMVADELCISESAAHFHCKNIYKKLGISNRRQLLITYKDLYR